MKKRAIIIALTLLVWLHHSYAEDMSLQKPSCLETNNIFYCMKENNNYNLTLQKHELEIKKEYDISSTLLLKIDEVLERFSTDSKKIELINEKTAELIITLWNTKKDRRIKAVLQYVIYKWEYHNSLIEIDENIASGKIDITDLEETDFNEYIENKNLSELQNIVEELYDDSFFTRTFFPVYLKETMLWRDTDRNVYLKKLAWVIETYFADNSKYPSNEQLQSDILPNYHIWGKFEIDPLAGYTLNGCKFWYRYQLWERNWINNSTYQFSTCVENPIERYLEDMIYENWGEWENFSEPYYINQPADLWEYSYPKSYEELSSEEKLDFYKIAIEIKYAE